MTFTDEQSDAWRDMRLMAADAPNSAALVALKESIAHWQECKQASNPNDINLGPESCALCSLFKNLYILCDGCPVKLHTDETQCDGSPYYAAHRALYTWKRATSHPNKSALTADEARDAWRVCARAEVEFLESLLPDGAATVEGKS